MTRVLVLCNHATPADASSGIGFDNQISINAAPPGHNLKLEIDNITHEILSTLNPIAIDLLEIASYVYYADCSVSRGSVSDVFAERWRRKFEFVIPISNPDLWNSQDIKDLLAAGLEFLSGDEYSFTFLSAKHSPLEPFFQFPDMPRPFHGADCISLFSGGLDSLVGSLYNLKRVGDRPLLISHRSLPRMDAGQKRLAEGLRQRNQEWEFPHLSVWVNRLGNRAIENTQRTRSFLYLSLAAAVASELKITKISISENGVVSINIPISGQNIGTFLTRSTHPKFLKIFENLVRSVFNKNLSIINPFIFNTKAEMLQMLSGWGQNELIQLSTSCSYSQGKTLLQPQCGTCFQCINRRFSVISAGLEEFDKSENYEKDIFSGPLSEGNERNIPIEYVRTAIEIFQMDGTRFYSKFAELDEVINSLGMPSIEGAEKIYALFKKHADGIVGALKKKFDEYSSDFLSGRLSKSSLISMVNRLDHLKNPIAEYSEKIFNILHDSMRINFRNRKPTSERELQQTAQAMLDAAGERLRREAPTLSYSCVRTTPDLSNIPNFENLLFIEFKFLNSRGRLNGIITEITSRITIYTGQGAFALFIVYDAANIIADDNEFIADFERYEKIKVRIIRG